MNLNVYYGRFQPIHNGHIFAIRQMIEYDKGAESYIATSGTYNKETDPLPFEKKIRFIEESVKELKLPVRIWYTPVTKVYDLIRDFCFYCQENGGGVVTLFCGSDRVDAYQKMANSLIAKYQARGEILNVRFNIEQVVERGSNQSYSATQMRRHVKDGDFESFLNHSVLPEDSALEMFEALEKGMGLVEKQSDDPFVVTKDMAEKVSQTTNQISSEPNKLYYVGGCVRDQIMGNQPKDLDLVTTMYYKDYADLFNTTDIRYRGSNIIVVPIINGESYETACLSKGVSLKDRLLKSDLTMNAMAQDILTGEIIDPLNGRVDIQKGILRNTDFMIESFIDGKQPVAVLRTIRFYATTNMDIDSKSMIALYAFSIANKGKLKVTDAQFQKEFQKVLKADRLDKFVEMMNELDLTHPDLEDLN